MSKFLEQEKEFVKSKQAAWDQIKIQSTKYLFCCKIAGLLENSYHKCALDKIVLDLNYRGRSFEVNQNVIAVNAIL